MAEIGGTKPNTDKLHWADGGSPNPTAEPSESKKDDGFVFEDIPPASEENWWRKHGADIARWISDAHIREFDYLPEAIAATSSPDIFRVRSPATGLRARGGAVFNVQGSGGAVTVTDSCTDGQYYYYIQDNDVYAANTLTGAQIWTKNPRTGLAKAIDCDGRYAIVAYPYSATANDLFYLDQSDGTILHTNSHATSSDESIIDIASNGTHLAVMHEVAGAGFQANISIYDITGTPVLVGVGTSFITTATPNGKICIDDEFAFGTYGDKYIKVNLSTYATFQLASTTVFTTITDFNCISADGLRVYITTDRKVLIAGGNAHLLILNRENNNVIYTRDLAAIDLHSCSVDGNYLYFSSTSPSILTGIVEKYDCQYTWGTIAGIRTCHHCCDGISFFGTNNSDYITRNWIGATTKTYQRALGTDPVRRPFYNLAIPAHDEE